MQLNTTSNDTWPVVPNIPGIDVELTNVEMWRNFHQHGNEFVISKKGRTIFPCLSVVVTGLEAETDYSIYIEIIPASIYRYKYDRYYWLPDQPAYKQNPKRIYLHPYSPARGSRWLAEPLYFESIKITNDPQTTDNNLLVLLSMHKYVIQLHIIQTADYKMIPYAPRRTFQFPETEFMAVTYYHNNLIRELKINLNPCATAFRNRAHPRYKRRIKSNQNKKRDVSLK